MTDRYAGYRDPADRREVDAVAEFRIKGGVPTPDTGFRSLTSFPTG
ncbi:hypothetical protein [Palleronia abyssalis]|nr:hypothetical protein [Palleronia abyssalis]